jgi:FlxA-like protein
MISSSISSPSTGTSNTAQIAALERQLAKIEKQLQTDQASGGAAASTATTQLLTSQITLVETEIAALSNSKGANLDVTA